ncbi:DUF2267 domain-containing protein [Fibrivirga algicola]|uniref:DUF2267 domain-containing protein n=1 Tax=Fibrivirga algicola TaxID=2950420 RepID=A0ABX0QJ44_9BACT|nr:DUF2267 domain-containing protein [Fibrivirga algicola]ARK12291.1 hypothetical protein A6C57_19210 [Fibrella sp. ES10-3-2-2]NID10873.1 DUF2267 domain-containing protein [Fibrivirga algicola]
MQYPEFVHAAKQQFGVTTETDVLTISRAFLHTLTDHLAGNAADNMGAQLPAQLLDIIREIGPEDRDQGQRFKLTEFYERVADRAGVDDETGKRYTHQFVQLLSQMITADELRKIAGTLSDDYAPLFETAGSL